MKNLLKMLVVLVFVFIGASTAKANTTEYTCPHNPAHECVDLKGYAWGADNSPFGGVGWINFKGTGSVPYSVYFDRGEKDTNTGEYTGGGNLYGYAWSERYGYIKFGNFTEGNNKYPNSNACVGGANNDASCNTQIRMGNSGYEIVGYARFCFVYQTGCSGNLRPNSERGGYDGWIAFKGNNVSVAYSTSDNKFIGYAWAGGNGNPVNSQYGKGSGWISMSPKNGGVSCDVVARADCFDDQDKPIITLTPSKTEVKYNEDLTLSWTMTNIPNGCSAGTSSNPTNSTWNGYAPQGTTGTRDAADIVSGSINVGKITTTTTFTISCSTGNKQATASAIVKLLTFIPEVTLSAPSTVIYGESAKLDYTVKNIPYNCKGVLYRNGAIATGYDNINVTSDGTKEYTYSDSITISNIIADTNWQFSCTDNTAPAPERTGFATAKTELDKTVPTITFTVKDVDTNSTTTIPCSNNGVKIEYSSKDVLPGSCRAYTQINGSFYSGDPDWGSNTVLTENDGPTIHSVTTAPVTKTGDNWYTLQCRRLNGNLWTANTKLSRNCTAGSISVTAAASCITPAESVDITYVGTDLVSGTCSRSWAPGTINQSNFNLRYTRSGATLNVGQTYTYTVSGCKQNSNPNGASISSSTQVEVQNTCINNNVLPVGRNAPTFKEF